MFNVKSVCLGSLIRFMSLLFPCMMINQWLLGAMQRGDLQCCQPTHMDPVKLLPKICCSFIAFWHDARTWVADVIQHRKLTQNYSGIAQTCTKHTNSYYSIIVWEKERNGNTMRGMDESTIVRESERRKMGEFAATKESFGENLSQMLQDVRYSQEYMR